MSVFLLFGAFGLGILKEINANSFQNEAAKHEEELRNDVKNLKAQLAGKTEELAKVQNRVEQTQLALEQNVENLSDDNFMEIEAKFHALSEIRRDYFHSLTNIDGTKDQKSI